MKRPVEVPDPARLRTIPRGFGWVDHRLLRDGHLAGCGCPQALALYLVLVTAADARGISYYSEPRLAQILAISVDQIVAARKRLVASGLIAWRRPYYQVLSLEPQPQPERRSRPPSAELQRPAAPRALPGSRRAHRSGEDEEALSIEQALRELLEEWGARPGLPQPEPSKPSATQIQSDRKPPESGPCQP